MKKSNSDILKIDHFNLALKLALDINQETDNLNDIDEILRLTKQILKTR